MPVPNLRIAALAALLVAGGTQAAEPLNIDVHRSASCGCCKEWIDYLKANGFAVHDHVESDMPAVKQRLGVAPRLASCHTAEIDGKFVEGHIPVAQILELRRRPDLLGVAAPGMPAGSPGMAYGDRHDAYQIIGLTRAGQDEVLADYPGD